MLAFAGSVPEARNERSDNMARTARIKKTGTGTSHYHLMSRANDRGFLFEKGRVKTQLVDALKRAAAFSGIEIDAYSAMDNHFHVVCKVVRPEEPVPEDELVRLVAALKGGRYRATCMRYVYFNPVRAGIVSRATDYALCWMAAPEAPFSGSVPEGWLMRRVAQIGGGKVFGSEAFVVATVYALGSRFQTRHVPARAIGELDYATHGWKLAKEVAA